jgi:hypothetical protein
VAVRGHSALDERSQLRLQEARQAAAAGGPREEGLQVLPGGRLPAWTPEPGVFDPVSGAFTPFGVEPPGRGFTATTLEDGSVLLAGGVTGASREAATAHCFLLRESWASSPGRPASRRGL